MQGLDPIDDEDGGTVFRDVIMLALLGFVAIVIMLLPHLHPPAVADADTNPPGNVVVEIRWPDDVNADVDLWVEAPGDQPVGYSNKGGMVFNLLRDDLGHTGDVSDMNYEVSYSRGIRAGEYTVNVHLFSNEARSYPVTVSVIASVKSRPNQSLKQIVTADVELQRRGEERTVFRFSLDDTGNLVTGSVHDLPKPLRNKTS